MRLMLPKSCFVLLIVLSIAAGIAGLLIGPVQVSPAVLLDMLTSNEPQSRDQMIIQAIRLPRMLLSFLIGTVLASCGAVLQGLFRNSLADPSLIGVSAVRQLGQVLSLCSERFFFRLPYWDCPRFPRVTKRRWLL